MHRWPLPGCIVKGEGERERYVVALGCTRREGRKVLSGGLSQNFSARKVGEVRGL
jgi:hypothetical protein